jgi:hypothetical protein
MPNMTHEELVNDARTSSKVIALIYSPVELYQYIVEIITKDSSQFLKKGDQIINFDSLDQAVLHTKKYGVDQFFLCADNTYDECGSQGSVQKFEFIPIDSK